MDNRPIGIFDSGLGGLTGMKALLELLPDENIVYFADSGRAPYGSKTREQVRRMAEQNLTFISSFGVKAVLVACGTISSNAADLLEAWPIPTTGVLQPTADFAGRIPGSRPVAVAATAASIQSGSYQQALREHCSGRAVVSAACPEFVPLIEAGHCSPDDPLVQDAVARSLLPVKEAGAELLVLGCTHYGLIADAITAFLGPDTRLISASACGAAALCGRLLRNGSTGEGGKWQFFTSGDTEVFNRAAEEILGSEGRIAAEYVEPFPLST